MRVDGSTTRALVKDVVAAQSAAGETTVTTRDLAKGMPFVDHAWIEANFTPADKRSESQRQILAGSDALVAEVQAADIIVLGAPMYNFTVPAAVKAWIDMIARVGMTFVYTERGPVGCLAPGKTVLVVLGSGGVPMGAPVDHTCDYLRHFFGFLGIADVRILDATGLLGNSEARVTDARSAIPDLIRPAA